MAYEVTVTDMVSAHSATLGRTSNLRVALRWKEALRVKYAGTATDVGVWDEQRDRWVYEDES